MHPKRIERPFALTVLEKTVSLKHLDQDEHQIPRNRIFGMYAPGSSRRAVGEVTDNPTLQAFVRSAGDRRAVYLGNTIAVTVTFRLSPGLSVTGFVWEQAPSIVRKDDNGRVDPLRVADPRRNRAAILLVARPSRSRPTIDGAMNSRGTPSATVF